MTFEKVNQLKFFRDGICAVAYSPFKKNAPAEIEKHVKKLPVGAQLIYQAVLPALRDKLTKNLIRITVVSGQYRGVSDCKVHI